MGKIKGSFQVNQNNFLIEAKHNTPLTLIETRIIKSLVSTIQPSMEDISCIRLNLKDFMELIGMKNTNQTHIKRICANLSEKRIDVQRMDSEDWIVTRWVAEVRYLSREKILEFDIPRSTQGYFKDFSKGYVHYELKYALMAKSVYTVRIYELSKKWFKLKSFEYELDELRKKIGAIGKSYDIYGNFKAKALKPAIDEINEITDIKIDYKEIKDGKKVVAIKFSVKPRNTSIKRKKYSPDTVLPPLNKEKEADEIIKNMF
ncbi:replication initiation protein [Psychrobacillus sp. MER TA 171]|uniref:replication initiation protein n=1 Tax=Psychrobacillus sp. MER TA 171 TaxID=2939577 RepID=UPI00203FD287|nr:replication initiation protein [Psychrobacillus sp. MER TA 171]MCM3358677.1 replication initiation protein [Psychrobacillus sp. MER TA 171]